MSVLDVPQSLTHGSTISVSYSCSASAGQTIAVEISNGSIITPIIVHLDVRLDSMGNGTKDWVVLDWDTAIFNAPGAAEASRFVF